MNDSQEGRGRVQPSAPELTENVNELRREWAFDAATRHRWLEREAFYEGWDRAMAARGVAAQEAHPDPTGEAIRCARIMADDISRLPVKLYTAPEAGEAPPMLAGVSVKSDGAGVVLTAPPAHPAAAQEPPLPKTAPPFAVYDEFGRSCDDRIQTFVMATVLADRAETQRSSHVSETDDLATNPMHEPVGSGPYWTGGAQEQQDALAELSKKRRPAGEWGEHADVVLWADVRLAFDAALTQSRREPK